MKEAFRLLLKISFRILLRVFWIFPVEKNKVTFLNDSNFMYSDSPKCIVEYLKSKWPGKVKIVFASKKPNDLFVHEIEFVKFESIRYFYHVCTSRVFVTNGGGVSYIPFRKKQTVVNTWHGGGAYKAVGASLNENFFYKRDLKMAAKNTNVFLSSCKKFSDVMSRALLIPADRFLEIGLPRNDLLIENDIQKRAEVKSRLGMNSEQRMLLYAPTFRRNDASMGENLELQNDIDFDALLKALSEKWNGEWVIGYRAHPGIRKRQFLRGDKIMDLSDYPEMQELLLAADILITDYSSCAWDFMLTHRPVFIYASDLKDYAQKYKFYTPISEWPHPIATNMEELVYEVENFDPDKYENNCKLHYMDLGGKESGCATKFISEYIGKTCGLTN